MRVNAFPEQAPLGWRGSRRWRLVARQIELSQQALPHRYNLQAQSRHGTNSHSCDINRSGVLFYLLFTVRYPSSLFRWFGIQCLRVFSHLGRFSPRRELRDQLKHTCTVETALEHFRVHQTEQRWSWLGSLHVQPGCRSLQPVHCEHRVLPEDWRVIRAKVDRKEN